jgi:hypothetical protein
LAHQEEVIRQTHGQRDIEKEKRKMAIPVFAMIALLVLVIGSFQMFGEYLYDYNLSDTAVEFLVFRKIKVWSVPFNEITAIEPASWKDFFSLKRMPFGFVSHPLGKFILIKRSKGIFKHIIVTPNNQNEFVDNVRSKITNQGL